MDQDPTLEIVEQVKGLKPQRFQNTQKLPLKSFDQIYGPNFSWSQKRKEWRKVEDGAVGTVRGIPNLHGKLIGRWELLAQLEDDNGNVHEVHFEYFVPDATHQKGKSGQASSKPHVNQDLVMQYLEGII